MQIFLKVLSAFLAVTATISTAHAQEQEVEDAAVVHIQCTDSSGTTSTGSGIVFSERGHVLTAKHVAFGGSTCKGLLGRADEVPTRELRIRMRSDDYDFAILQFNPTDLDEFKTLEIAPQIEPFDEKQVVAAGFPSQSTAVTRRPGRVASTDIDDFGGFDIGVNTAQGMSGGGVVSDGKLIGLVAKADFDQIGQVSRYVALASDVFYGAASEIRRDIEADKRAQEMARLARGLSDDGVCTQLLREAILNRYPGQVPGLDASAPEQPTNELAETAEYWVTITTGPARWLDCREDTLQKSHYFPMGLLLRPLRDLRITDDFGEERVWTVFQAEYGLLVLIDRRAVAPVTEDVGYIFSDGTFIYKLCGPNDTDCNPGRNLPPYNPSRSDWPFLTSQYSYLRTNDIEGLQAALAEYESFVENQKIAGSDETPFLFEARMPQTLEEDPACKPRQAQLYRFFKTYDPEKLHENSEFGGPVTYSFCVTPPDGVPDRTVRWRPMNVVTYARAQETFSQLWWAAVEPGMTEVTAQALRLLQGHKNPMLTRVDCLETTETLPELANAASNVGLGLGDIVAEQRRVEWSSQEPNFAYHFRPYRTARGRSPSKSFEDVPLYQDVDLKIYCGDDRKPFRAREIRVHLYPVFLEPIVLQAEEVENWYLTRFGESGFEGRKHLANGYIERICNYNEYYGWRSTLEKFLLEDAQIQQLSEPRLRVSKRVVARHFAHLIMASLFFTDVQLQVDNNSAGRCPT